MKNGITKLMALAGGLAVGAGMLAAQEATMTLEGRVPFAFQAGKVKLPAGDYRISHSGVIWTFTNVETSERIRVLETANAVGKKDDPARAVFACSGPNCVLRAIYEGNGNGGGLWAPSKKAGGREEARIVVVPVGGNAE